MAHTFGKQNNFHPTINNPTTDGTLLLTFDIASKTAHFTYQGYEEPVQGPWKVTFLKGVQPNQRVIGTAIMESPSLSIPHNGQNYTQASFSLKPSGSVVFGGSLTGSFVADFVETTIDWEADAGGGDDSDDEQE